MNADPPIPLEDATNGVRITRMLPEHAAQVARLHVQSLPPSFFSRLGAPFLRRYYQTFVDSPYGIALVATRQGNLCGYVVGTTAAGQNAVWTLRRRGLRLAAAGLLALLTRPRLAIWFLHSRAARYARGIYRRLMKRAAAPAAGGRAGQPAVLAHVAVHSPYRRIGAGALLVSAFERELVRQGVASFELVTLCGPEGAGAFYERLEFDLIKQRTDDDGKTWCYYRKWSGPAE